MNDINDIKSAIENARRHLETDPHLANYILRDHPFLKKHGLDELAWGLHRDGCLHKNDVIGLIADIEKAITAEESDNGE